MFSPFILTNIKYDSNIINVRYKKGNYSMDYIRSKKIETAFELINQFIREHNTILDDNAMNQLETIIQLLEEGWIE